MTDRYAVFGNPIKHSKSPDIHKSFARQFGHDIEYCKQCIEEDQFKERVKDFFSNDGKGLNITVPFKEKAFEIANEHTQRAQLAGAVNFLMPTVNGIKADNTDGFGLVLDITENLGWQIKNKRVLVLGAGGAVRGVLLPLLNENPKEIVLANRTVEKAEKLAQIFSDFGSIRAREFWEDEDASFDLIINGTSASLHGEIPILNPKVIATSTCVYDMVYSDEDTAFMTWAKSQNAEHVSDGFGMLVGQAAESYRLWRGVMPNITQVVEEFKKG